MRKHEADEFGKAEREKNGIVIDVKVFVIVAAAVVGWKYIDYLSKVKK